MVSYILLFFLLYCYAIWMKSRQPIMKGREGEALVAKTLKRLSTSDYSVLHNVMLRTGTQLTQIDHIIISVYGISIIETKHYKGIIIGSDKQYYWQQRIGKKRFQLRSPIKQNIAHVLAVSQNLNLDQRVLIPMVVFTGQCTLRVHTKSHVLYLSQLMSTIRKYQTKSFTPDEVVQLTEQLRHLNVDCKKTRKEHIKQINQKKKLIHEKSKY